MKRVFSSNAALTSWNTRCGLIGTLSKSVRRSIVRLRSATVATQALRRRIRPARSQSRATSRKA